MSDDRNGTATSAAARPASTPHTRERSNGHAALERDRLPPRTWESPLLKHRKPTPQVSAMITA